MGTKGMKAPSIYTAFSEGCWFPPPSQTWTVSAVCPWERAQAMLALPKNIYFSEREGGDGLVFKNITHRGLNRIS